MMWGKVFAPPRKKNFPLFGTVDAKESKVCESEICGSEKIALLDYCLMSRELKLCRL